ncbi:MAG: DUF1573 domain-containing protein [Pyrinomonadaceae bacterium]|nr:DUF1573 domain-containing protein [Phycisphaerales bacterium]
MNRRVIRTWLVLAAVMPVSSAAQAQLIMPIRPTSMRLTTAVFNGRGPSTGADEARTPAFPLVFSETEADGGEVLDSERPVHAFHFTNRSDRVVIPAIQAKSSGLTYSLSKRSVAPGESGVLSFYIPVVRTAGTLKRSLDIFDINTPDLRQTLRFQVDVIPTMSTAPEIFSLEVPHGEGATLRAAITGLGEDFTVLYLANTATHPMIDVEIGAPVSTTVYQRAARRVPILIKLKPDAPVGPINAHLRFKSNKSGLPDASIRVGANVVGPLTPQPKRVEIRLTEGSVHLSRVVVTARDRMPWMPGMIEVVSTKGPAPAVDWEPSIVDGVFAIILNVRASADDADALLTGNILVRSKGVDQALTIPYSTIKNIYNSPVRNTPSDRPRGS